MKHEFPAAVPEIPVSDMNEALDYCEVKLAVNIDFNTHSQQFVRCRHKRGDFGLTQRGLLV